MWSLQRCRETTRRRKDRLSRRGRLKPIGILLNILNIGFKASWITQKLCWNRDWRSSVSSSSSSEMFGEPPRPRHIPPKSYPSPKQRRHGLDTEAITNLGRIIEFRILWSCLGTAAIWANYLHPRSLKKVEAGDHRFWWYTFVPMSRVKRFEKMLLFWGGGGEGWFMVVLSRGEGLLWTFWTWNENGRVC